jgi:hypothetical protein
MRRPWAAHRAFRIGLSQVATAAADLGDDFAGQTDLDVQGSVT